MSDLEKLKFPALDVGGSNYIVWALEAKNYLCADGIGNVVEETFVLPAGSSVLLQRNHDERRLPPNGAHGDRPKPEAHFGDAGGHPRRGGRGRSQGKNQGRAQWKQKGGGKKPRHAGGKGKAEYRQRQKSNAPSGACHKCGLRGHWANKCTTPEFHCKLFQDSKTKGARQTSVLRKQSAPNRKVSFMTDFSDDSDHESHCVESYSNDVPVSSSHCLVDCATTHVILSDKRFFVNLEASKAPSTIKTVGGSLPIARGAGRAQVCLPNGTVIDIKKAIYAPSSSRNLLSFTDLRKNGYHVNTATMSDGKECLQLVDRSGHIVEECPENGNGLYFTHIVPTSLNSAAFATEEVVEHS